MKVLLTGGAGYLGSTLCHALLDCGHTPVVIDSLVTGRSEFIQNVVFYHGDIADHTLIERIFDEQGPFDFVMHCAERAGLSSSVGKPYEFYTCNVVKSMEFLKSICDLGCKKIIFSSTSSIYEDVPGFMVTERSPINPKSPFARTKYITELILKDFCLAYDVQCITLRYFNVVGADPKGRCGMQEKNPANIISSHVNVMDGKKPSFEIAGNNWGTRDGTCMRDYVHVWDAAMAAIKAMMNFDDAFARSSCLDMGYLPINIGAGIGVTVREFVFAFENVTGEKIPVTYGVRRPGDSTGCFANVSRAFTAIEWEAKNSIEEAILNALAWEEIRNELLAEV